MVIMLTNIWRLPTVISKCTRTPFVVIGFNCQWCEKNQILLSWILNNTSNFKERAGGRDMRAKQTCVCVCVCVFVCVCVWGGGGGGGLNISTQWINNIISGHDVLSGSYSCLILYVNYDIQVKSRHFPLFADDVFRWIFSMKSFLSRFKFHWILFLRIWYTMTKHLFR